MRRDAGFGYTAGEVDLMVAHHPLRKTAPAHPPHPEVIRLLDGGWTHEEIASAVRTVPRCVWRWAAGDTKPLPIFVESLQRLPTEPLRLVEVP